ncbi:MAG: aglS [Bacteriovoracaceae bacterium]|nr:aglS [Bacteriovoracaceae bacterium]
MKRRRQEPIKISSTLMLTPMLDMLTVVLIFLIVNFSPEKAAIKPSANIQLPEAELNLNEVPRIHIELAKDHVMLNGQTLAGLLPDSQDSQAWNILKIKLEELTKESKDQKPQPILLIADKDAPYQFVDSAVAHLAAGGYSEVYLLTSQEDK